MESERINTERQKKIEFPTDEGDLTPEKIIEILNHGKVEILGLVEDHVPDVKRIEHQNRVNFALVAVEMDGKRICAIFKPLSGEGIHPIKEFVYEGGMVIKISERLLYKEETIWKDIAYYPREVFAFLVSEKLGLHIVPPTVVREIEIEGKKEIGALQVFIPRDKFQMASTLLNENKIEIEEILHSSDAWKIAVLDFLLGYGRRTWDDILVEIKEGTIRLLAIDHGNSMAETVINEWITYLPSENLISYTIGNNTYNFPLLGGIRRAFVKNPKLDKALPKDFIKSAENLLEQKEQFREELKKLGIYGEREDGLKLITEEDFEKFFFRLELLIKLKTVL